MHFYYQAYSCAHSGYAEPLGFESFKAVFAIIVQLVLCSIFYDVSDGRYIGGETLLACIFIRWCCC